MENKGFTEIVRCLENTRTKFNQIVSPKNFLELICQMNVQVVSRRFN